MSAEIISNTDGIVTVKISELFTYEDQLALQNATADIVSAQSKIGVLTIYENFEGWSHDDRWEDVSFQEQSDPYINKMAIVGVERWRELALMFVSAGFRSFPVAYFESAELDKAQAWLNAQ
jgi:ABC-type sugar transport system permease subunit